MQSPFDSPLSGFRSPFGYGRRLGFSVAALFANSEQGVAFEPDPNTCFTDTAGTTPAGVGDAVALMLDKSQGAGYSGGSFTGLGSELVTNGTFDTDLSGWTDPDNSTTWESGRAFYSVPDDDGFKIFSNIMTLNEGSFVLIEFDYEVITDAMKIAFRESNGVRFVSGIGVPLSGTGVFRKIAKVPADAGSLAFSQDTPGSASEFYIDNFSARELPGNHATQDTAAARPLLQQTAGGLWYLEFDGVDDFMQTPSIDFTGTDEMSVFAGVRKLSDINSTITELGSNGTSNNGSFMLLAIDAGRYQVGSRGTVASAFTPSVDSSIPPVTNVLSGLYKISADSVSLRQDGALLGSSSADQGTGNYMNTGLRIGARNGTSFFLNGHIYSLIVRGKLTDAATIDKTEAYVAGKTGITL